MTDGTRVEATSSSLLNKSLYFGLQVAGSVLSKTTDIANRIADRLEPIAVQTLTKVPIPDVKPYLKPIPDPRLRIESPVAARKKAGFFAAGGAGSAKDKDAAERNAEDSLTSTIIRSRSSSYSRSAGKSHQLQSSISSTSLSEKKQLYQIRNEVGLICAMGIYSIPYSAKFFDYITPTIKKKTAVDSNDLKSFHIYSSGAVSEQLCFSFAGSSWLFFYEIGVAIALQEFIQAKALQECLFMGVSTGSFVAACLALELPLERVRPFLTSSVCKMSRRLFGPIGQCSKMWTGILNEILLDNVDLANDRLFISLTKLPSMENQVQSKFSSKMDLMQHILASCYMPVLFETPVKIGNDLYINGSYQNHISTLENVLTITCSPDAGEANICPGITRYTSINKTFPPNEIFVCDAMIDDGFKDAKKWLSRMFHTQTLPERFFQPDFKTRFLIK